MECVFCHSKFTSKTGLNTHIKTAKYCLSVRNIELKSTVKCGGCSRTFARLYHLQRHETTCNANEKLYTLQQELLDVQKVCAEQTVTLRQKDIQLEEQKNLVKNLSKQMHEVALKAVSHDFRKETIIEIEPEIEPEIDDTKQKSQDSISSLNLGQGYEIEHREEDGYVNVTNLCKAGGKQFKAWNRLARTKAFISALSNAVTISTALLIKYETGYADAQGTWVHPQVAINIAQWISPQFDIKVSAWVYEVMMTGKVDITNTKSYRQLQSENKDHKIKIKHLTNKYMKKQPRLEIKERNVIYILTTRLLKKERRYILGKAINLTNRLSTYNKSDEHEIVYYKECGDEDNMSIVEPLIFSKLKEYREQANRERFILPEGKEISLFVDVINQCVEFV